MGKVLIVEDNELNLKLFHDLLMIQGHDVFVSKDGLNIIEELKKNDVTKHIPIIAITAFAMKNDKTKILKSGCDMYISKPVSIDTFFKAINKFIEPPQ